MKKILLFCIMISLIITSCCLTSYTLYIEIEPEIYIIGDSIGLTYMLNDFKIVDEIKNISPKKLQYIIDNKDDIKFNVIIKYDEWAAEINAEYYIKGIKITTNSLTNSDILIENIKLSADKQNKGSDLSSINKKEYTTPKEKGTCL